MFAFFALFIPSVIVIRIIGYFNKDLKIKDIIYDYITLFFFSFIINIIIMYNFFGVKEDIFKALNTDIRLFVWISLISIIINVILCLIGLAVQRNIKFNIEVKNETKTETVSNSDNKTIKMDSKVSKKTKKTVSKAVKKDKNK